ncbi:nucleotidyltransferase domain-containing protein [Candidatus Woesearchaeota archaeon]|nr:nucleotidyltransferase domain-containing protein [Candidatus Woesearchaeota archaeon]
MASASKEENILQLILENSPLKEWHFEEIVREAEVTRAVANKWLKKYITKGLLKKVKEKKRFPYITVGSNNPVYYSQKRLYALEQLHRCGLIPKLLSLHHAKTVILFGSIAKGDWYKDSDIDIFVLGNLSDFDKNIYESKLRKHIELHQFADKKEIGQTRTGLIKNIINGYIVKGQIQDIAEVA